MCFSISKIMLNWQAFPLRLEFIYGETLCDIPYASGTIEHQAIELKSLTNNIIYFFR